MSSNVSKPKKRKGGFTVFTSCVRPNGSEYEKLAKQLSADRNAVQKLITDNPRCVTGYATVRRDFEDCRDVIDAMQGYMLARQKDNKKGEQTNTTFNSVAAQLKAALAGYKSDGEVKVGGAERSARSGGAKAVSKKTKNVESAFFYDPTDKKMYRGYVKKNKVAVNPRPL